MKKYMLSLSAVVLGVALAFAGQEKELEATQASQWFQLIEGMEDDPLNPQSYVAVSAPQGCNASQVLCAIYAESNQQSVPQPTQFGVENPELRSFKAAK